MKYRVTFVKTWDYEVEAENESEALNIAEDMAAYDLPTKADWVEVKASESVGISERVTALMDEEYLNESGNYSRFGEEMDAIEAISQLFKEAGFSKDQFSVDYSVVLYSPSGDYGCLSVAYIEDGKINHLIFDIE